MRKCGVVFSLSVLHEGRESRFEPGWLAGICLKAKIPYEGVAGGHPCSYLFPLHSHVRLCKELEI